MTLQSYWLDYRNKVYPETIPPLQRKECHQAFMAGALAVLSELDSIGHHPENEESNKADVRHLEGLMDEVRQFAKSKEAATKP